MSHLWLILSLCLASALIGCSGNNVKVSGSVKNGSGTPASGATVQMTDTTACCPSNECSYVTDSDGHWGMTFNLGHVSDKRPVEYYECTYTVVKEGYSAPTGSFKFCVSGECLRPFEDVSTQVTITPK